MTVLSTCLTSMRPLPMVLATAVPKVKAATKLKNAAHSTAWPGVSTRVVTTVAMEVAAVAQAGHGLTHFLRAARDHAGQLSRRLGRLLDAKDAHAHGAGLDRVDGVVERDDQAL